MKTKPKARAMWAIYDNCTDPIVGGNRALMQICEQRTGLNAIRVAVIPLDDVEAIVERAAKAMWRQNNSGVLYYDREHVGIRAALTAAGIPCKRRARK